MSWPQKGDPEPRKNRAHKGWGPEWWDPERWGPKGGGAHLRAPAFENTTQIQREDTQRDKKSEMGAGEEKKKRNFGRSGGRGSGGGEVRVGWRGSKPTQQPHNTHNNNTTTTQQQHNNNTTTTQRQHNDNTTTTQRPHNDHTTTTQQQHNNTTTHNNTQQHTTTHNNTQQHTTTHNNTQQIGQNWIGQSRP